MTLPEFEEQQNNLKILKTLANTFQKKMAENFPSNLISRIKDNPPTYQIDNYIFNVGYKVLDEMADTARIVIILWDKNESAIKKELETILQFSISDHGNRYSGAELAVDIINQLLNTIIFINANEDLFNKS